jgi:hypothetical protein
MLDSYSLELRFLLCSLANWRLTHFVVTEEGPWNIVVRFRVRLGESMAGRAMDCFFCSSLWLAIPFAFLVSYNVVSWIVAWLAISGAACLLEQATQRQLPKGHDSQAGTEKPR